LKQNSINFSCNEGQPFLKYNDKFEHDNEAQTHTFADFPTFFAQPPISNQKTQSQEYWTPGIFDQNATFTETVPAKGEIKKVDKTQNCAFIRVFLPSLAAYPNLVTIAKTCEAKLCLGETPLCEVLISGDRISFLLTVLPENKLQATSPQLLKLSVHDSSRDFTKIVKAVFREHQLDGILLAQILAQSSLPLDATQSLILGLQSLIETKPHLFSSCNIQESLLHSTFLAPDGFFCCAINLFSQREILALRDVVSTAFMLNLGKSRLFVHIATLISHRLLSMNFQENSINFIGDLFRAASPLNPTDPLSFYSWWQLPSVPLCQEMKPEKEMSKSYLENLPSVLVGQPYQNIDTYISTYMSLHRADCYYKVTHAIKSLQAKSTAEAELPIFNRIIVCGLAISDLDCEITMHLSCVIENPKAMKFDNLVKGNMVAVSLEGSFADSQLIWGVVEVSLNRQDRQKCRVDAKSLDVERQQFRVFFKVKWCKKANQISDSQILDLLRENYYHARLIENAVPFVSYAPVLDRLRSFWKPGTPLVLPFAPSLLAGTLLTADDNKKFQSIAKKLNFLESFDRWQLKAFNHASKYSMSLIQGPPGTGKSYLGSRIARTLAECSGRVLVITFKNHALDEILLDIVDLYDKSGVNGLDRVIRIGNINKIDAKLSSRTLQSIQEQCIERSPDIRRLVAKCRHTCKCLSQPIFISAEMFLRATGMFGREALRELMSASFDVKKLSDSQQDLTFDELDRANKHLVMWSKNALEKISKQSVFDKVVNEELFLKLKAEEDYQNQTQEFEANEFERNEQIPNGSFLAFILNYGLGNELDFSQLKTSPLKGMAEKCKESLLLNILRNEFRFLTSQFLELDKRYDKLLDNAKTTRVENEGNALRSVAVIGSTLVGSILNMDAISAAQPTALLLEEAGEIPEAAFIALLRISTLQRCVMIGDHQQLRPTVKSYDLLKAKRLDISCFERLVKLGMPVPSLRTQNRMREDVLTPVVLNYPKLRSNKELIQNLEVVPWLRSPLFWWECETPSVRQDSTSWYNEEQAHRMAELAHFLVIQGSVPAPSITVLVPYVSQLLKIRLLLHQRGDEAVLCSTIDQYQGDENDVILLSLVRCDEKNPQKIGFLAERNRMIVATSRQKRALVICGSSQCFSTQPHWKDLIVALQQGEQMIGKELPLMCPRHPSSFLSVPDSRCFPSAGGCAEPCQVRLEHCTHICSLKCHPLSTPHGTCRADVRHTFKDCSHTFMFKCYAIPASCQHPVEVTLRCGHRKRVVCGKRAGSHVCEEKEKFELLCGHSIWLACGTDIAGYLHCDFNACFQCLVVPSGIDLWKQALLLQKDTEKQDKNELVTAGPIQNINPAECKIIVDAVIRLSLCQVSDAAELEGILLKSNIPRYFFISATPNANTWNSNISQAEREFFERSFAEEQNLWKVLLDETGFKVAKEWQKHSFTFIACLALLETANCHKRGFGAKLFSERLKALHSAKITTAHAFVTILKTAGEELYKKLCTSEAKDKWYQSFESELALIINHHLFTAATNETVSDSMKVVIDRTFDDSKFSKVSHLKECWGLPSGSNLSAPPSCELPCEFLYQASLADSLYISIDLKSADFHILNLAVPELLEAGSWDAWVQNSIPSLVKTVPFLTELKSLRVRTLGKFQHSKNAALQSHCMRILMRLVVSIASLYKNSNSKVFDIVERVFQFSCDELCIKLRKHTSKIEARLLSEFLSAKMALMNWEAMLPLRVELFYLQRIPYEDKFCPSQLQKSDISSRVTRLYFGHPLLRFSGKFLDSPGNTDQAWSATTSSACALEESCEDSYYVRNLIGSENRRFQLKKLPHHMRPAILLNHLKKNISGKTELFIQELGKTPKSLVVKVEPREKKPESNFACKSLFLQAINATHETSMDLAVKEFKVVKLAQLHSSTLSKTKIEGKKPTKKAKFKKRGNMQLFETTTESVLQVAKTSSQLEIGYKQSDTPKLK